MSDSEIKIPINGDPQGKMDSIRQQIASAGGSIDVDVSAGVFVVPSALGTVKGKYQLVEERTILIKITEKPPWIAQSLIEDFLESKFST